MTIAESIEKRARQLCDVAERIWEYAEIAFEEKKSAQLLCDVLEREGFHVAREAGGIKTAFVAEYGSGGPVIGLCAEYDALEGLSQMVDVRKHPRVEGAPGHGCAHNLLGAGSLAAALAVKDGLALAGQPGNIRRFCTREEEVPLGKPLMVRAGLFEGTDVMIGWHPDHFNAVMESRTTAMCSVKFHYHGVAAHAAIDPYNGRSALDAVELLNISANYLREHIRPSSTIHYSPQIKDFPPNVVPDTASVWYFVRATDTRTAKEIYNRLVRCAKAAAEMTDTTCEVEFLGGCSDYLPNRVLEQVLWEELDKSRPVVYSEEDKAFIAGITENMADFLAPTQKRLMDLYDIDASGKLICDFVAPLSEKRRASLVQGSMDIGDVSYLIPTAYLSVTCCGFAVPGHSWSLAAYANHEVGKKGMLRGGEVMGTTALRLMREPETIERAKEELQRMTKDAPYVSMLPDGSL